MKKQLPGFALLEAAMALMILGIIASFTFPMITSLMTYERTKRTADHREQILRALAGYAIVHNKLPWPDKPGSPRNANHPNIACKGAECKGIVPYEKLGIPKNLAKDGHGHWFTYAVHSEMTGINETQDEKKQNKLHRIRDAKAELLHVKEGETDRDFRRDDDNPIAIILISHGPFGGGAYYEDGQDKYQTEETSEKINAEEDLNFITGDLNVVSEDGKKFTHQVFWITKNQFVSYYAQNLLSFNLKIGNNDKSKKPNDGGDTKTEKQIATEESHKERIRQLKMENPSRYGLPKVDNGNK